jgi:tetratricopeptide (TPR) repeat protein
LNKQASEIFKSKVGLIYEYNKSTPLLVRMANFEIENNNVEKAIGILQNGKELYPDYPTIYFVLGKAYTILGKYQDAKKNFEYGSNLINSKKTYDYYFNELENISKQRSLFELSKKTQFLTGTDESFATGNSNLFDQNHDTEPQKEIIADGDNLENLAKKISEAKLSNLSDDEPPGYKNENISDEKMIISETLAKIYASQGEINEAIKIYEKLKLKNPSSEEYYSQKIGELKSKLDE